MWLYCSLAGLETMSLLFKEQQLNEVKKRLLTLSCDTPWAPNRHVNYLKEIIISFIHTSLLSCHILFIELITGGFSSYGGLILEIYFQHCTFCSLLWKYYSILLVLCKDSWFHLWLWNHLNSSDNTYQSDFLNCIFYIYIYICVCVCVCVSDSSF